MEHLYKHFTYWLTVFCLFTHALLNAPRRKKLPVVRSTYVAPPDESAERRAAHHQKLKSLTIPERNEAEEKAVELVRQIEERVDQAFDQYNPGTLLMQNPDWVPLLPALLSIIKGYSRAEEITFKQLSDLTEGQTWLPSQEQNMVHVALCRSKAAAYHQESVEMTRYGKHIPNSTFCRTMPIEFSPFLKVKPEDTFCSLKKKLAKRYKILEDDVSMCVRTHRNVIIPCSGLESFLQEDPHEPHFMYALRLYNNKVKYDLEL